MAHELGARLPLRVEQTLHGYAQGHQLLAASIQLRPRDAKTMLVLSDISGPGLRASSHGYLTGYPLPEAKVYVVAKTWPAQEMPRPGCVWTQSLLLDFADMATLDDPLPLLSLFRRPQPGDSTDYARTLTFPIAPDASRLLEHELDHARRILAGLYEKPTSRIIFARDEEVDTDRMVLALWAQQWPRLRRNFRFCTLSGADRSMEGGAFDLQLVPSSDRSARARFPSTLDFSDAPPSIDDWVEDAVADLRFPDMNGLRTFMRNVGGDIDSGREAFQPLCRLHVQLKNLLEGSETVSAAIQLVDQEFGSAHARAARAIVSRAAIAQPNLDMSAVEFVIKNLDLIDADTTSTSASIFGRNIWKLAPQHLSQMLAGTDQQREIAENALMSLSTDEALEGMKRAPQLAHAVLQRHPQVLETLEFWRMQSAPFEAAFSILLSHTEFLQSSVESILDSGRSDLIPMSIQALGAKRIFGVLAARWDSSAGDHRQFDRWLAALAKAPVPVAEFLSSNTAIPFGMLVMLARLLAPDGIPNEYGDDPWWLGLRNSRNQGARGGDAYLYAYLIARALGTRSRSQAELVSASFDVVHKALLQSRLAEDAWHVLETRLPRALPWLSWDRSQRLRDAVNDLFIGRNLSADAYAHLTMDDDVFQSLARSAARSSRGRQYLGYVGYALNRQDKGGPRTRIVSDLLRID